VIWPFEESGGVVHLYPTLCLNTRLREPVCMECLYACPADALHLTGDPQVPISLDSETCRRCGICVSVCPMSAFIQVGQRDRREHITRAMKDLRGSSVELVCPQRFDEPLTRSPADVRVQAGMCLAALSLSSLLAWVLILGQDLWLDDTPCMSCPYKGKDRVISLANQANRLLEAWGREERVRLVSHASAFPHPVEEYKGPQEAYTRREAFQELKRMVSRSLGRQLAERLPPPPPPQDPGDLPVERQRLLAVLPYLGTPVVKEMYTRGLPFATVSVSDACTGCDLCTRVCPTQALVAEENEEEYRLSFIPARCLGCDVCVKACPVQAIETRPFINPHTLLTGESEIVIEGRRGTCEVCNAPIRLREGPDGHLCHVHLSTSLPHEHATGASPSDRD